MMAVSIFHATLLDFQSSVWVSCTMKLFHSFFFQFLFLFLLFVLDKSVYFRFEKKIRYASRKARADVRKREKGRFVKAGDAYDYDPLCQTRSF